MLGKPKQERLSKSKDSFRFTTFDDHILEWLLKLCALQGKEPCCTLVLIS
jgi:hypothetical protein